MGFWLMRSNRIQDHISTLEKNLPKARSEECKQIKHLEASEPTRSSILDPGGKFIRRWNALYLIISLVSLVVDPSFFLLPTIQPDQICIQFEPVLKIVLIILRSLLDVFYVIHIFVRFRTSYISPGSRAIGRGELVMIPRKIAIRYLKHGFFNDLMAAIPLPQVIIWIMRDNQESLVIANYRLYMLLIILGQMVHRFCMVYPLSLQLAKASGIITEKAWSAVAYNLIFFLLTSMVSGCWWYLLAIQRLLTCWKEVCDNESPACVRRYLGCSSLEDSNRSSWLNSTKLRVQCDPINNLYQFGIFNLLITENLPSGGFTNKFFYCLWWGIRNLCSQAQNLYTSIDIIENIFSYIVGALGLVTTASFLVNMMKYLQTTNASLEDWDVKQNDMEQWMHHRQLPQELKLTIRSYNNYKWMATRGVVEEHILGYLPSNLQRQTKRFLCFNLVRRVPLFEKLDERTLDAVCERLKPTLFTKGMDVICEGERVTEMIFIIRGHLITSYTTMDEISNCSMIGPNEFCGEELFSWALDSLHDDAFPSSTRTIKAISNVEGFSLGAEDLKFITKQFHRKLRSREFRNSMRFHSHQWRTWGARFIQAAWRRFKKRNQTIQEYDDDVEIFVARPDSGIAFYAARLITDMRYNRSNANSNVG